MKTMLIPAISIAGLLCLVVDGRAAEVLRRVDWGRPETPQGAEVGGAAAEGGGAVLRVQNCGAEARTVTVATIEAPSVTRSQYAIRGRVRCEGVENAGYLEMWSHFPGEKAFFSRTLVKRGPLRSLGGSQKWRDFVLPFFLQDKPERPERLVVNVVLPGRGTVWLGPLELAQFEEGESVTARPGQWWGERMGGLIGGVAGSLVGLLGATVGILASLGRARRLAVGLVLLMLLIGMVGLVSGGVALLASQPYAVYYPCLLLGVICTLVGGGVLTVVRARYRAMELRKMEAADAT